MGMSPTERRWLSTWHLRRPFLSYLGGGRFVRKMYKGWKQVVMFSSFSTVELDMFDIDDREPEERIGKG